MSDHTAPRTEKQLDPQQPSPEATPEARPDKSEFSWVNQVAFFAFLAVVSTALFYPTAQRYRSPNSTGATRSVQAEQAERIRQIAEAQQLADESDAAR